jgi:hypothetical protein
LKIERIGLFRLKTKKKLPRLNILGTLIGGHISPADGINSFFLTHLAQQSQSLSNASSGRKVITVADGVVVGFGLGVTYQEASAQILAFETINPNIVRTPRVYRIFSRKDMGYWSIGYLIMEHIEGENLEQIAWDKDSMLPRIAAAVREIHSISDRIPGPVSGGEAHGNLWSEQGSGIGFRGIEDLQAWMNKRLSFTEETVSITEESMCLCHLDMAPRNFMIDPAGRLCLLDECGLLALQVPWLLFAQGYISACGNALL